MRNMLGGPALAVVSVLASSAAVAVEAPPLEAYGELPRVEDVAISPDGKTTAAVIQSKGERHLLALDESAKPIISVPTGKSKVRGIQWADDGTILLTNSATVALSGFTASKFELTGTIIVSTRPGGYTGMVFKDTTAVADTTRGQYGLRTINGRSVGYFGGIAYNLTGTGAYLDHARTTLYAVDLQTNRARMVAPAAGSGHYRDWLVDASGTVAVTLDVSQMSGLWRITTKAGQELARGVDPTGDVGLVAFGQTGATVIYQIEDEEGSNRWFEVPLAGGEAKEILAGISIERIFLDRSTGNLLGYRTLEAEPKSVMSDPAQQAALTKIFRAFKDEQVSLVDWTPGFGKVLVRTSGSGNSGTIYMVDVPQRRAEPVGYERPQIAADQVGPISVVRYKAQDGLEMDGILTLPPGRAAKNLPVVLLPHGGPAAHDTAQFDWWAQALASRGYAVFQPNFRGSTGRSDSFRWAGNGQWGRKMQTDISDGLAELARQGVVDPKRACIVGASYGGYAALAGVTLQQGLYRCAASVAGVTDLKLMYVTDLVESGGSKMLGRALREQLGDPKGYDEVSPRRFAAQADAPVLLIHGKDDTVVAYKQSTVMANALKSAGKPYELVTLPGEDHWLSREETRKQMLAATVSFVQKHNPAD